MKATIRNIIIYFAIAIILNWLSDVLKTNYLSEFLKDKIIELLVLIMTINTATFSIIVTKLEEISAILKKEFPKTIQQVKQSHLEQVVLLASALIVLMLNSSPVIQELFPFHEAFFNIIIYFIFIYAIDILRDTGLAIFDIINYSKRN